MIQRLISGLFAVFLLVGTAGADVPRGPVTKGDTGLEIPRFVSMSSSKVFMRAGPGMQYPIDWVYKRRGLPLLVVGEHDTWRKVQDHDGITGWVHVSLLTGVRTAMITAGRQRLFRRNDAASRLILTADAGVSGKLLACDTLWCRLEIEGRKGWVRRDALWGIFKGEIIDE